VLRKRGERIESSVNVTVISVKAKRQGKLGEEHIKRLEEIGLQWTVNTV
jgi:hypothetical protein